MGPTLVANPQEEEKICPIVPSRRELYPAVEPYRTGFLQVSQLHNLYWEENGNPAGQASASCVSCQHQYCDS